VRGLRHKGPNPVLLIWQSCWCVLRAFSRVTFTPVCDLVMQGECVRMSGAI
jgi:hypothetical protein